MEPAGVALHGPLQKAADCCVLHLLGDATCNCRRSRLTPSDSPFGTGTPQMPAYRRFVYPEFRRNLAGL